MMMIGMAMMNANLYHLPQPTLVTINDSDKTDLKKLKGVILKMTANEPKERHNALKVANVQGDITCLYANILFEGKHLST